MLQQPSPVYVLCDSIGASIRATASTIASSGDRVPQTIFLYAEKRGGFSCRTCRYAIAQNATHGRCAILDGVIHLDNGCCAGWDADKDQLMLYKEATE